MILLDTHVLIWLDEANARLGRKAVASIDKAYRAGKLAASAISFWEVGMLVNKGRILIDIDLGQWRKDFLQHGLIELPVTGDISLRAAGLSGFHGDPADRLIAATAMHHSAILLTADERLLSNDLPVKCVDASL